MEGLLSIGEVAKRAGVSVGTLRHYDKLGLVRPSQVTEAGYRLYSQTDCERLELVRTLRGVGFDLGTVARLLQGEVSPSQAVELQLGALEVQARLLRRRQAVLKAVSKEQETAVLVRLSRMQTLAKLDRMERESFLGEHLRRAMGGSQGNPEIWRAAVLELPEELSEAQLGAWLELAELVSDERFQETLRFQTQPVAGHEDKSAEWAQAVTGLMSEAMTAVKTGLPPSSRPAQELLGRWTNDVARDLGREADTGLGHWLLDYFERAYDPRLDRYWQLIATLKGWEYSPLYAQAYGWLLEALRQRVAARR
jgi:DNA-binding transcriptional MerR regulator